ncbi:DUF4132 domain-containing protein [Psychrobacter sp. I-STPA6b]|uniref:DUF4132 domain-containing protein n=1 Tax=Psychrobacter sp. I-STPA6b TaxID=2585718 RepID=UPI001D0C634A|nr:DUF4132 domain-containing protein [Psychrobacter sp. I-STPA6b]
MTNNLHDNETSTLSYATPDNQFHWSKKQQKILDDYRANRFAQALAYQPKVDNTPIQASDIKATTLQQEQWLALANEWIQADDDALIDYQNCAEQWQTHLNLNSSDYSFTVNIIDCLFAKLSLSKQISFTAILASLQDPIYIRQLCEGHRQTLFYIQARIHQLKQQSPKEYEMLFNRHQQLLPALRAFYFLADVPYPRQSFEHIKRPYWEGAPSIQILFIHHTYNSAVFVPAYKQAVSSKAFKDSDTLPPLLDFIALSLSDAEDKTQTDTKEKDEQAFASIATLLNHKFNDYRSPNQDHSYKNLRQVFKVLQDYHHEHYLTWLLERIYNNNFSKLIAVWVNHYPIFTNLKMLECLNTLYTAINDCPDFSQMTKKLIKAQYYKKKQKYDFLVYRAEHLLPIIKHTLTDILINKPTDFEKIEMLYMKQDNNKQVTKPDTQQTTDTQTSANCYHVAPIFAEVRDMIASTQSATTSPSDDNNSNGSDTNKADDTNEKQAQEQLQNQSQMLSEWLTTPPWSYKKYRLQAPKLPEHLSIHGFPRPILQVDGSELALPLFENLLGILIKSNFKKWIKPLTDADMQAILSPFTRTSLNDLGQALWDVGIPEPWGWLMNAEALPTIESLRKQKHRDLIRMMKANIELWYEIELQNNQRKQNNPSLKFAHSADISAIVNELLYQYAKSKSHFRTLIKQALADICEITSLSLIELRDLAVPCLGFDTQGERHFDLDEAGNQRLTLRLDAHLSPLLFDEQGQLLDSFPRAKKGDDKERFRQVNNEIKQLKKQLDKLYKTLNQRFEQELEKAHHRQPLFMYEYFCHHPILQKYAQNLLWTVTIRPDKPNNADEAKQSSDDEDEAKSFSAGLYADNPLNHTFIMAEDGSFINADYDEIAPEQFAEWQKKWQQNEKQMQYCVIFTYPSYISQSQLDSWVELLADHAIAQPIEQINIPCLRATDEEKSLGKITRFDDCYFHINELVAQLKEVAGGGYYFREIKDNSLEISSVVEFSNEPELYDDQLYSRKNKRFGEDNYLYIRLSEPFPAYSYSEQHGRNMPFSMLSQKVQIKPIDICDKNPLIISKVLLALSSIAKC